MMMTRIAKLVLQGLGAVLPVALTLYLVYWLFTATEKVAKPVLLWFISEQAYFPGLGILFALLALVAVGILMNAYGIRYLLQLSDKIFARIPLLKSVYGALQDMMKVFTLGEKNDLRTVVSLDMGNDIHLIGFVTGKESGRRLFPGEEGKEAKVGVYLPMSYQIGGFTLYVDRERLRPLDIDVEEAMRIAVTGGSPSPREDSRDRPRHDKTSEPGDRG